MLQLNALLSVVSSGIALFYLIIVGSDSLSNVPTYRFWRNSTLLFIISIGATVLLFSYTTFTWPISAARIVISLVSLLLCCLINLLDRIAQRRNRPASIYLQMSLLAVAALAFVFPESADGPLILNQKSTLNDFALSSPSDTPPRVLIKPLYSLIQTIPVFSAFLYIILIARFIRLKIDREIGRSINFLIYTSFILFVYNRIAYLGWSNLKPLPGAMIFGALVFLGLMEKRLNKLKIAENDRVKKELSDTQGWIDIFLNRNPFGCALLNQFGVITQANADFDPEVRRLLSASIGPASTLTEAAEIDGVKQFWDKFACALAGEEQKWPLQVAGADGKRLQFEASLIPAATRRSVVVFLVDITATTQANQRAIETKHLEALGRLSGNVAHEYNNILAGVLAMGELSLTEPDPSRRQSQIHLMLEAARRGADLSSNLLSFARSGVRERACVDIVTILKDNVALVQQTRRLTIRITPEWPPANTCLVLGHGPELHSMLMNILLNACDAMDNRGQIEVAIATGVVEYGKVVLISIIDHGKGITEGDLVRVFEPFFTTKPAGKGSGLGLASAREIAAAHAGYIDLKSEIGTGTTATITLPLFLEATPPTRAARGEVMIREQGSPPPPQALLAVLVEDDPIVRTAVTYTLEKLHFQVLAFQSGEAALEAHGKWIDQAAFAFLDLQLPGISGVELCPIFRGQNPQLKIVLMTGYAEAHDLREVLALPQVHLLSKPFGAAALTRLIQEIETVAALQNSKAD